jgi:3-hydroxy-9,10-secoandrosta-1,3,5(10)-triene-9,17-dione monooxygenase reductase component
METTVSAPKDVSTPTSAPAFDRREFRNALGTFATGVTVITARAADGSPVGLTANSFNSVSLDPPLVLWGLAKSARSMPVFAEAEHWAVHVLAAEQEAVSNAFAKSGEDKFAGIELEQGVADLPLLPGCAARFQCRTRYRYEGGDHIIFVGEVLDFDRRPASPLVYHAGRYALAASKDDGRSKAADGERLAGSFDDDHLGYLLGRAHFQFYAPIRTVVHQNGLDDAEFFAMSTLSIRVQASAEELAKLNGLTGCLLSEARLDSLVLRGLLAVTTNGERLYSLTPKGLALLLQLTALAKAHEADLLQQLGEADGVVLKTLLRRLTGLAGDSPDLWQPKALAE